MIHVDRRSVKVVAALCDGFGYRCAAAGSAPMPPTWMRTSGRRCRRISSEIATVVEDPATVVLEAPYRAEDAALVPLARAHSGERLRPP